MSAAGAAVAAGHIAAAGAHYAARQAAVNAAAAGAGAVSAYPTAEAFANADAAPASYPTAEAVSLQPKPTVSTSANPSDYPAASNVQVVRRVQATPADPNAGGNDTAAGDSNGPGDAPNEI